MQAALGEVDGLRIRVAIGLEGLDPVEEGAGGPLAVSIQVLSAGRPRPGVPLLARGDAGMAADADIQVDDQSKLLGQCFGGWLDWVVHGFLGTR